MEPFETVYVDKTVMVTELYLKIFKYYLPLATSKTILFEEISSIVYHRDRSINVFWGASSDKLNDWFPFDEKRPHKKGYFEIVLKDKGIRPCFSPIDPERVFNIIWVNHSKEGLKWKKQCLQPKQPIILLSSKDIGVSQPVEIEREEILIEPRTCMENQDESMTQLRKVVVSKREPFKDQTNLQRKQCQITAKEEAKRKQPVQFVQFEEESYDDEQGSQKENVDLMDDCDFQDLS